MSDQTIPDTLGIGVSHTTRPPLWTARGEVSPCIPLPSSAFTVWGDPMEIVTQTCRVAPHHLRAEDDLA